VEGRLPRERVITLYGRMPVLEALQDSRALVSRVVIAHRAQGDAIDRIVAAAAQRQVPVEWTDPASVTRMSRNGRHDQGVVADVTSPGLHELDGWLADRVGPLALLVLDGVTNPANVGMIIRTATASGLDGVVLPRAGSPDVGPLVVKASAGVALSATVLRAASVIDAARSLTRAGVTLVGLTASADTDIWQVPLPERVGFVLGNETTGVSPEVSALVGRWCAIPLVAGVESLNVASAAAVLAFELARRRRG
jgi:23S rRNA (guanosine2251-2'-O)-methyltransferase